MSEQFIWGFTIGAVVGFFIGFIICAVFASNRDCRDEEDRRLEQAERLGRKKRCQ